MTGIAQSGNSSGPLRANYAWGSALHGMPISPAPLGDQDMEQDNESAGSQVAVDLIELIELIELIDLIDSSELPTLEQQLFAFRARRAPQPWLRANRRFESASVSGPVVASTQVQMASSPVA